MTKYLQKVEKTPSQQHFPFLSLQIFLKPTFTNFTFNKRLIYVQVRDSGRIRCTKNGTITLKPVYSLLVAVFHLIIIKSKIIPNLNVFCSLLT